MTLRDNDRAMRSSSDNGGKAGPTLQVRLVQLSSASNALGSQPLDRRVFHTTALPLEKLNRNSDVSGMAADSLADQPPIVNRTNTDGGEASETLVEDFAGEEQLLQWTRAAEEELEAILERYTRPHSSAAIAAQTALAKPICDPPAVETGRPKSESTSAALPKQNCPAPADDWLETKGLLAFEAEMKSH